MIIIVAYFLCICIWRSQKVLQGIATEEAGIIQGGGEPICDIPVCHNDWQISFIIDAK